ncbi:37S ribosomal S18 [Cordyceps militaris]|uniref:Small ribosomal subunit protein bS18m n=1 Tax=Cordyceps militaris TaxID=73501 RepID=A0A2H4ST11_CORMI|nr:37S ribosomal S18 [Cordyceps militaris]
MPMRLPGLSAVRAPSTLLLSFLRPFSSTAAVAQPPREPHPQPPTRSSTPSSTSRLQSINKDRMSVGGGANGRSPGASSMHRIGQAYRDRAAAGLLVKQEQIDYLKSRKVSNDYLRQMPRRWLPGDVYSPHDLSPREMDKWRRRNRREADVVDILGLRPLDMYKNFSLIQEFTTSSGQVKHSKETALRPVNQRKVAKMIRRIQGMGLYPTIHDHPELIRSDFYPSEQRRG